MRAKAARCRTLRPDRQRIHDPAQAAKLALKSLAHRVGELDREILELDRQLEQLVRAAAPRTSQLFGVGTQGASQLLIAAGQNINRFRSEAAFRRSAAPPRSKQAPAAPPVTASTPAATDKATEHST
jgi:transposase